MKENYCLTFETENWSGRPRGRKSLNTFTCILLFLFVGLCITGGVCWYCDQAMVVARAKRGEAEAQYLLGKRCFDRAQTMETRSEAIKLIRKSAEQGNAKAQTALSLIYIKGLGTTRDCKTGMKWLETAAAQNFSVAQNELGVLYATGLGGIPQNLDTAISWCTKAADQGSRIAKKNLALIQTAKRSHSVEMTTRSGEACLNVKVQKVESDGVMVSFQPEKGGVGFAKLKTNNLPAELQELCGYTAKTPSRLAAWLHLDSITSML
ncbi:MAG TPA: tetratricopeptide repeat protein [Candidatus Limnocylindrales bacterium]|jgi:hypothetical protein|nr:tetratricopeptide repeat protein [Candidatus Limnocylindrales bacterium]